MAKTRKNLTELTVRRLKKLIAESGLEAGEPLGIEAELEKKLKVSRPVLREAISRLRALGILDSRQSVGLIIGKPDPVAVFEQALEGCAAEAMDLAELAEFRYALEIGAVSTAVRRATPEQIKRLEELASLYAAGLSFEKPSPPSDEIELAFHRTLLEATHNRTMARMCQVIATYFARAEMEVPDWERVRSDGESAWEHRAIAQAMAERNVEAVRALLGSHLKGLLTLGENLPAKGQDET